MGRRATTDLKTATARRNLVAQSKPHYSEITPAVSLGYMVPHTKTADGKYQRAPKQSGSWQARVRKEDGRYSIMSLKAKADDVASANGRDVLTYVQAEERAKEMASAGVSDETVRQAATKWAENKNLGVTERTTLSNNRTAAERIAVAFERESLRTITEAKIIRWRDDFFADAEDEEEMRKRKSTANRRLAELKAILNAASKRTGYKDTKKWSGVEKFKKSESFGRRVVILTKEDESALLSCIDDDGLRNLVTAALLTGARYGELAKARVHDAYAETMRLSGKTGERTIVLGHDTGPFFKGLIAGANDPDRRILLRSDGSGWGAGHQRKVFAKAVKAAELDEALTFYCLRHTAISRWIANGAPIRAVAEHTGTSVAMIEKTYAKFLPYQMAGWFS